MNFVLGFKKEILFSDVFMFVGLGCFVLCCLAGEGGREVGWFVSGFDFTLALCVCVFCRGF